MTIYFRCRCSNLNTRATIYKMGISCKAAAHLLSKRSSFQTKDVKAGAPLFNHRILGEWHEGNECCCQSLLTVHRLFFKASACLSALWRRGERLVNRHALGSRRFYTLAHILKKPFLPVYLEEFHQTLIGWLKKNTTLLGFSLMEDTIK